MKSVDLTALRRLEIRDVAPPVRKTADEVLLKVQSVGICGSDVHYFTTGRIGSQVVTFPFRLGHEFSARVVETGNACAGLHSGDLVAVDPAVSCFACDQCLAGRPHTCRNLKFLGCPGQLEGCLCEYIVMPAHGCRKVSERIGPEKAALVEPLSIGCYAADRAGSLADARVAVLGCGPIGLSVLLAADAAGAKTVSMSDPVPERRAKALEMGAAWSGTPEALSAEVGPGEMDVVFECCGKQEALDQAVDLLKPGGTLMLIGIPQEQRICFDVDTLRRHELSLINVRRQNGTVPAAVRLIEQDPDRVGRMITHRGGPSRSAELFLLAETYRQGIVKGMIHFETK